MHSSCVCMHLRIWQMCLYAYIQITAMPLNNPNTSCVFFSLRPQASTKKKFTCGQIRISIKAQLKISTSEGKMNAPLKNTVPHQPQVHDPKHSPKHAKAMSINWWPTPLSLLFFHKLLYSIARQDQLAGVVSWKIFEDNSEYKGKLAASSKTVHTLRQPRSQALLARERKVERKGESLVKFIT